MSRKPKSTAREGFGILNPYGDMWTTDIFSTEEAARAHVEGFWRNVPDAGDLRRFRIVRASQKTSFVAHIQVAQAMKAGRARGTTGGDG